MQDASLAQHETCLLNNHVIFLRQTRKMQARHVQNPINGLCAVLPYINYTCTLQHCQGIFSNNSAGKVLKKSDEALDKSP